MQLWSLDDPLWYCRVTEGAAGVAHARWAPDARHVLTTADFNLHLTVWSLVDQSSVRIRRAKLGGDAGAAFSHGGGEFLAVAHREAGKDVAAVYAAAAVGDADRPTFGELQRFRVATDDLVELRWSKFGGGAAQLVARDSALHYRVLVYRVWPEASLLATYEGGAGPGPLDAGARLGVKVLAWPRVAAVDYDRFYAAAPGALARGIGDEAAAAAGDVQPP